MLFRRASLPQHEDGITPGEVRALLGPVASPLLLEIGANDGGDTRRMAAEMPGARIHCFECDPRAIERFLATPVPPHVTLHRFALGAQEGRATFYMSGLKEPAGGRTDWDLSGSLHRPTGHKERYRWCTFERTEEVQVRRLDGWHAAERLGDVDFVWMDVQGAEGDVIAGGPRTLARTRFLYTEFNDWKKPLYEGDLTLQGTLAALGAAWQPMAVYERHNLLLRNTAFAVPGPASRS